MSKHICAKKYSLSRLVRTSYSPSGDKAPDGGLIFKSLDIPANADPLNLKD